MKQNIIQKIELDSKPSFYPRIIREFEDERDEEPMFYGGNQLEKNNIRESLAQRLEIADIEYDIKRMLCELNYHKSRSKIFEQIIKARQAELEEALGIPKHPTDNGEMHQ